MRPNKSVRNLEFLVSSYCNFVRDYVPMTVIYRYFSEFDYVQVCALSADGSLRPLDRVSRSTWHRFKRKHTEYRFFSDKN